MTQIKNFSLGFIIAITLSACASNSEDKFTPNKSYLQQPTAEQGESKVNKLSIINADSLTTTQQSEESLGMTYLSPLASQTSNTKKTVNLTEKFSDSKLVQLTADNLPLKDYLHYVMGDLLGLSYILGEKVQADNKAVTLNLQQDISQRKLFTVSEGLLAERGYVIRLDDGIYYIHQAEGTGAKGEVAYGYGNKVENVPNTSLNIIQFVPFVYGYQGQLQRSITALASVKVTADIARSLFIIKGKQREVIKALDFIALMDTPALRDRQIGVFKTTYISTDEVKDKLPKLLLQEGLSVSAELQANKAVSLVTLDRTGTIVFFANSKSVLERVNFWLLQLDQPPSGTQLQYFIYNPQYSRATDLGESLNLLIGGSASSIPSSTTSAASQNNKSSSATKSNSRNKAFAVSNDNMSLVVDVRANALIFHTTGDEYRDLLPLIKRLDVMPKQVILEMMIAEVTLTDSFKQGVDFVLTNQGGAAQIGGFNLSSGSGGLTYLLSGSQGSLTFNLLQSNTNVNVLSRPTLLVRDGVTASITVGDDIPTVGEIITDPVNGSQTSVVYRKTGVELSVTPTINARGVVIMEIEQKISNQTAGDESVAGSPIIFERGISTEVVAESGQTIVLGGLISENRTKNKRSVPFFSSIPFLGNLFNAEDDTKNKTELVVLVTPRIIESSDEWEEVKAKFTAQFDSLSIE